MPSTTTVANHDSIATRTRRSAVSNTSFDSASLDGHSLFSSDDMAMTPRSPIVATTRENGIGSVGEKKRSTTAKGGKTSEGQRGVANISEGKMDKRLAMGARVVPAESTSSNSKRIPSGSSYPSSHKQSSSSTKARSSQTQYTRDSEQSSPPPKSKNMSKSTAKSQPSIMMSMSALIEQNEDAILHYSMPKSNVLISSNRSRSNTTPKLPAHTSNVSPPPRRRTNPGKTDLARRRSRSLENFDRVQPHSGSSTPTPSQPDPSISTPSSSARTASKSHPSSRPSSQGKLGYTSSPLSKTPHSSAIRSPTSLDAFAELSVGIGTNNQLYLTKNGVLQNTMTAVELTRGSPHSVLNGDSKGKTRAMESPFSVVNSRRPPSNVPEGSVLVQVWAVGLDVVDATLCGVPFTQDTPSDEIRTRKEFGHGKRSASDTKSLPGRGGALIRTFSLSRKKAKEDPPPLPTNTSLKPPELGYTPGRSFVGRVVEVVDMDDREMGFRKGDWVIGLLDLRKCGALQEYIIVDRRRMFRVPPPALPDLTDTSASPTSRHHISGKKSARSKTASSTSVLTKSPEPRLTIDELALLPLCGVQAYRAMRTLKIDNNNVNLFKVRRILVLNGHDGIGALATQMLAKRGWKVVVHVPGLEDKEIVAQIKSWGGDAVIFDGGEGAVKTMERLVEEGDSSIDAILDTIGGKDIWVAGENLLKAHSQQQSQLNSPTMLGTTTFPPPPPPPAILQSSSSLSRRLGSIRRRNTGSSTNSTVSTGGSSGAVKQFTTTIGDFPDRPVPSASDHFKSGIRSMRKSGVDYTWVSLAQDIDFEGGDIRDALKRVIRMALEEGVRPASGGAGRVVGLERTPEVFITGGERGLEGGNTVVVRVVE
ncbi:hypothetical protein E1B28_003952 [Marasmius oreades]|uniref:Uncharacterized protein n=1 Tax=Marasmius oreades TaxID=181124 RepID=A0A9P8ACD0_9AGAR|nr:uncharacterized protein E1B28_003952 [Marasmius oreades]KAG7096523.1 hypothetical protein E1B28_003952 [Marasmius oreades]